MPRAIFALTASLLAAMLAGCHPAPLPEQDSASAQVYIQRCGQCHSAYNPHAMTAAMWQVEVPKMEEKIRLAGLPALDEAQKQTILDYLTRNAGTQ